MKTYNLFISHSWNYSTAYDGIKKFLDDGRIWYKNHSVPKNDPIHTKGTDKELELAIRNKMRTVHCVLIVAGVYGSYSKWIKKEIKIAKELGKPILAIKPWAQTRLSSLVQDESDEIVGWNGSSVIRAIRGLSL